MYAGILSMEFDCVITILQQEIRVKPAHEGKQLIPEMFQFIALFCTISDRNSS